MRRIGLYARVSTKAQNPQNQILPLREYARSRWPEAEVEEYTDVGLSGASGSRPALDRLLKEARARRVDAIVVWKLDRMFRSTRHLLATLEELRGLRVDFVSLTEQIDTASPRGEALFAVVAAMAQLERDLIRERVRAGLERARACGVRLGRPPKEVEVAKVLEVYERFRSVRQAARMLGLSRSLVHRIIKVSRKGNGGDGCNRERSS